MTKIRCFSLFILCMLLLGVSNSLFAQSDGDSNKLYRFIYVAHDDESMIDYGVDIQKLRSELSNLYERIQEGFSDPSIFYLSNGMEFSESDDILRIQGVGEDVDNLEVDTIRKGSPVVIRMYVDRLRDNRNRFDTDFMVEFQKSSHDVKTDVDLKNILHILKEDDFLTEDGKPRYKSVSFEFYVNPRFWELKLHEKLIAALYFVLDVGRLRSDNYDIRFNIHHMMGDASKRPSYWQNQKADFGLWNIAGINEAYPNVQLMQ